MINQLGCLPVSTLKKGFPSLACMPGLVDTLHGQTLKIGAQAMHY